MIFHLYYFNLIYNYVSLLCNYMIFTSFGICKTFRSWKITFLKKHKDAPPHMNFCVLSQLYKHVSVMWPQEKQTGYQTIHTHHHSTGTSQVPGQLLVVCMGIWGHLGSFNTTCMQTP